MYVCVYANFCISVARPTYIILHSVGAYRNFADNLMHNLLLSHSHTYLLVYSTATEQRCSTTEFRCPNREIGCIPLTWVCDGENDCGDESDEIGCGGCGFMSYYDVT